jgi:hypothetical protein
MSLRYPSARNKPKSHYLAESYHLSRAARLFLNDLITDIEDESMWKIKQWAHIQTTREVIQGQGLQRKQHKVNGCENIMVNGCENIMEKGTHDITRKHI